MIGETTGHTTSDVYMGQAHEDVSYGGGGLGAVSLRHRLGMALVLVIGMCTSPEAWAVTVSPTAMTFQAVQGATNPSSQTVNVSASTKYPTFLMAKDSATWLTISPEIGPIASTASVAVTVNPAGLAAGTYSATVTITVGIEGSVSFPVTVKVTPATTTNSTSTTSPSTIAPGTSTNTMATLTWNPVTRTNLAGYKVYVGTASGRYGAPLDVGNVTSYVVGNLALGNTYYFVVTSYSTSGSESGPSNEVSKSIY